MTSSEFEKWWAERRGLTVAQFRAENRVVLFCACESQHCLGWAAMLRDQADSYIKDLPGAYGYRYPLEGE